MIGIYYSGGLVAGLFKNFSRIGVSLGFLMGSIVLSIYINEHENMISLLLETGMAIFLLCLIPSNWLDKAVKNLLLSHEIGIRNLSLSNVRIKEMTSKRLFEWANIFTELSETFRQASDSVEKHQEKYEVEQLLEKIGQRVCENCALYRTCSEQGFHQTYQHVLDMLVHIETNGKITVENLPEKLQKRCARLKEMTIAINCLYDNLKLNNYWQKKLIDSRDMASEQLQGVAKVIHKLSAEMEKDIELSSKLESTIVQHFKERRDTYYKSFYISTRRWQT